VRNHNYTGIKASLGDHIYLLKDIRNLLDRTVTVLAVKEVLQDNIGLVPEIILPEVQEHVLTVGAQDIFHHDGTSFDYLCAVLGRSYVFLATRAT
jgi:hypothetical protein